MPLPSRSFQNRVTWQAPIQLPPFQPLRRITPTSYLELKRCLLKGMLASMRIRQCLPISLQARLGRVVHKLLCARSCGGIRVGDFEKAWKSAVLQEEQDMLASETERHLVPIEKNAYDYYLKKIRCKNLVEKNRSTFAYTLPPNDAYFSESWLETEDGLVGGYPDAIVRTGNGDIIIDYKTSELNCGGLMDEKIEDYATQIKLYAALFHSKFDLWPSALYIVGINGSLVKIEFDEFECMQLLRDAKNLLHKINLMVRNLKNANDSAKMLASPSNQNCKYCGYRPMCTAYVSKRSESSWGAPWPYDAFGTIDEIRTLGNGSIRLKIKPLLNDKTVFIRGIQISRHAALRLDRNCYFFNLVPDAVDGSFTQGIYTTIYCP